MYQRKERREENIDLSISLTLDEHPNLVLFKMLVLFLVSPFSTSLTHYLTLIKTFVSLCVCAFMRFHTTNTFWLIQTHIISKKINVKDETGMNSLLFLFKFLHHTMVEKKMLIVWRMLSLSPTIYD